jgi:membrane protease YdiL (CAAX protease family)
MHNTRVDRARHGLVAYLLLVAVVSAIGEGAIVISGRMDQILWVMLLPALASVIVRFARREGFGVVSFRWTGRRTLIGIAAGVAFPIAIGTIAYGLAWMLGLAELDIPDRLPGSVPILRFLYVLVLNGGVLGLYGLIGAAGEEIGWRGYMLLRLVDGKVPYAIVLSGLIWGAWHLPLILGGVYADGPNALASAGVFMLGAASLGYIIARLRLATGSIWPPIALHAFWNSIIQGVFDRVTIGSQSTLWVGESGVLVIASVALFAVLIAHGFGMRSARHSAFTSEWSNS